MTSACIARLGHLHHRLTKEHLDAEFAWPDRRSIEVAREDLPEKLTVMVVGGNGGD